MNTTTVFEKRNEFRDFEMSVSSREELSFVLGTSWSWSISSALIYRPLILEDLDKSLAGYKSKKMSLGPNCDELPVGPLLRLSCCNQPTYRIFLFLLAFVQ